MSIGILLVGSIVTCRRGANVPSIMQVAGSACLMTAVLPHMCEARRFLGWPATSAAWDIISTSRGAICVVTLFPWGYVLRAPGSAGPAGLCRGRVHHWRHWRSLLWHGPHSSMLTCADHESLRCNSGVGDNRLRLRPAPRWHNTQRTVRSPGLLFVGYEARSG